MIDPENFPRPMKNLYYRARLERLVEPEPWCLRVVRLPPPYYGVVIFALIGNPDQLEKPIADAIRRDEPYWHERLGSNLYLMLYLSGGFWEARTILVMNRLSEFTQKRKIHSALIDRWLDSVKQAQLSKFLRYDNQGKEDP